jgi:hypothetical protein
MPTQILIIKCQLKKKKGLILEARQKSIISLVEDIRLYLMRRFEACRECIKKVEGNLCSYAHILERSYLGRLLYPIFFFFNLSWHFFIIKICFVLQIFLHIENANELSKNISSKRINK